MKSSELSDMSTTKLTKSSNNSLKAAYFLHILECVRWLRSNFSKKFSPYSGKRSFKFVTFECDNTLVLVANAAQNSKNFQFSKIFILQKSETVTFGFMVLLEVIVLLDYTVPMIELFKFDQNINVQNVHEINALETN